LIRKAVLLLLILAGLVSLLWFGLFHTNNPSLSKYPIRGIDISHYQTNIDWDKLKKEKISFIYIKATEGATKLDDKFKAHWIEATKHNYHVGAYHYYIPNRSGKDQAANFINNVPNLINNLPPVIDLEFSIINKSNKTKKQLISEISDFINEVESHYNKTIIIYTNISFYNYFIKENFKNCKLWISDKAEKPRVDHDKWLIWQYTHHGRIKGFNGYVDLNVLNGTLKDLK
jgi:lysozyme